MKRLLRECRMLISVVCESAKEPNSSSAASASMVTSRLLRSGVIALALSVLVCSVAVVCTT